MIYPAQQFPSEQIDLNLDLAHSQALRQSTLRYGGLCLVCEDPAEEDRDFCRPCSIEIASDLNASAWVREVARMPELGSHRAVPPLGPCAVPLPCLPGCGHPEHRPGKP